MDGWIEWMDGWIKGVCQIDGWMDVSMDGWMDIWMDVSMDGWMDLNFRFSVPHEVPYMFSKFV